MPIGLLSLPDLQFGDFVITHNKTQKLTSLSSVDPLKTWLPHILRHHFTLKEEQKAILDSHTWINSCHWKDFSTWAEKSQSAVQQVNFPGHSQVMCPLDWIDKHVPGLYQGRGDHHRLASEARTCQFLKTKYIKKMYNRQSIINRRKQPPSKKNQEVKQKASTVVW